MKQRIEINTIGQSCPMPLLMLKKAMKKIDPSEWQHYEFLVQASDPNSRVDLARYCEIHQLDCFAQEVSEHEFHYLICSK
ncbi:MAG: sulfurtransferase TusA family protein [Acinetobacter sp.]|nr:sulfurtransferase TusA family protein [Acinetobacter sp.]